jgi:hypothetical protein
VTLCVVVVRPSTVTRKVFVSIGCTVSWVLDSERHNTEIVPPISGCPTAYRGRKFSGGVFLNVTHIAPDRLTPDMRLVPLSVVLDPKFSTVR